MPAKKRATWFVEEQQIKRLLNSFDPSDDVRPVIHTDHRDQLTPDFVLSTKSGDIGIEVTSSTDEEVNRGFFIHETKYPNNFIHTSGLRDRGKRRSNQDLVAAMLPTNQPPFERLEDAMIHKATKITDAITRKREKLQLGSFEKYDQNWLLIHDDFSLFWNEPSLYVLLPRVREFFEQHVEGTNDFNRVYIFCGTLTLRWHEGKLMNKFVKT